MASSSETRISPYSLPDLKNTTDDALGNYLRGLDFRQDNTKLDFRLIVGYIAVAIAAATFVADYKLGWEATKVWTALAVGMYTAFNGIFTFWMWFVEAGLVFEGAKGRQKVRSEHMGDWLKGEDCGRMKSDIMADLHLLQDEQERPDILPDDHDIFARLRQSKHMADQGSLHDLVHVRWVLRGKAVPAMVGH